MMHSHNQVVPGTTIEQIQEDADGFSRPRAAHADRTDLYRGSAAGRRTQGQAEQDRAARLRDQTSTCRECSASSRPSYTDGPGSSTMYLDLDSMTIRVLAGVVLPLKPFPGTIGVGAQGSGALLKRAARRVRRQYGHPRLRGGLFALCASVCAGCAAVDRRFPCPARANGGSQPHRARDRLQGIQHHGGSHQGQPLDFPRIETAKSWITMGFDADLNKAWAQAKAQTVKFLSEQRSISAEQAGH